MDPFQNIDHYVNFFNDEHHTLPRTLMRDLQDPYDMEEQSFKQRYRFNQDVVKNLILPIVEDSLRKPDNRGYPVAPEIQILVCLRFYASGSFQVNMSMNQSCDVLCVTCRNKVCNMSSFKMRINHFISVF